MRRSRSERAIGDTVPSVPPLVDGEDAEYSAPTGRVQLQQWRLAQLDDRLVQPHLDLHHLDSPMWLGLRQGGSKKFKCVIGVFGRLFEVPAIA